MKALVMRQYNESEAYAVLRRGRTLLPKKVQLEFHRRGNQSAVPFRILSSEAHLFVAPRALVRTSVKTSLTTKKGVSGRALEDHVKSSAAIPSTLVEELDAASFALA